jgi:WD40 repeat protein
VALTPDGRRAVSASDDRTLRVWDLATGAELARLTGHEDWVLAVALTPDGRRAVSASDDRTLRVWDMETGQELAVVALDGRPACVAVVPSDAAAGVVTLVAGDAAGNVYCLRYVEPGRDR